MAIELEFSGPYALLTLNRPDALNALRFSMIDDISQALDRVEDSNARALIVTGAGDKAFCAGADIKELMDRAGIEEPDESVLSAAAAEHGEYEDYDIYDDEFDDE